MLLCVVKRSEGRERKRLGFYVSKIRILDVEKASLLACWKAGGAYSLRFRLGGYRGARGSVSRAHVAKRLYYILNLIIVINNQKIYFLLGGG